ncbi:hypothetical protein PSHT_00383 [Puccinia striiformis]|uniref:Uncharacterized protein n=1 Tax=Puccinia striiformis TaxID=27350 RepID=A0A2S4WN37_9BASI|nr:hypothetical protein PSHT_00383 [Puccinia striiformis]
MNRLTFDNSAAMFNGPNFLRFCGKFTVYTELTPRRHFTTTTSEAVVSGLWSGGRDVWRVSLRTDVTSSTSIKPGSTYEICGEVEGANAYFMPILIWRAGDERLTRLGRRLSERAAMRFSGLGTIVSWERFVVNAFEKEDLIQVVVFHKNEAVLNGGTVVRLLLGWDYCHVDSNASGFVGSRIGYVGSFQGSDSNDGSPIVQVHKAVINFTVDALNRDGLECDVELSDDFN